MDPISASDKRNEVARLQSALLHVISDGLHRVRQIQSVMLAFPGLDQRDQYVEPIACGELRRAFIKPFDLLENSAIVAMRLDRCDIHDLDPQMLCASIASYCRWVPTNLMYTTRYG